MRVPPLLVYSVLRLLAFLVPLGILWFFFPIFREFWWLAALFAALIGISVSLLFLRAPLSDASRAMYARRAAKPRPATGPTDEDIEDAQAEDEGSQAEDEGSERAQDEGSQAQAQEPSGDGTEANGSGDGTGANGAADAGSRHVA